MPALRDELLELCFSRYDGVFASGLTANNKLDLEKIQTSDGLRRKVAEGLGGLIGAYKPDVIAAVPNGANWIADEVARTIGAIPLLMDKDPLDGSFFYRPGGRAIVHDANVIVVVDDVLNNLTNTRKLLDVDENLTKRVRVIAGIWDRNPERQPMLTLPVMAMVQEAIPAMLSDDSDFWRFAQAV